MSKVYLAGPMRGYPKWNFPAFDEARDRAVAAGWSVISPADLDREIGFNEGREDLDGFDMQAAIARDLAAVQSLEVGQDAVALLPGWAESSGARAEAAVASWRGLAILDARTLQPFTADGTSRTFTTGATRNADSGKFDYEGFLSPLVIERFGAYMHEHRHLTDGTLRDSDNWQKGMPRSVYVKSLWRHFLDLWKAHRLGVKSGKLLEDTLCALYFNVAAYLNEVLIGREVQ